MACVASSDGEWRGAEVGQWVVRGQLDIFMRHGRECEYPVAALQTAAGQHCGDCHRWFPLPSYLMTTIPLPSQSHFRTMPA